MQGQEPCGESGNGNNLERILLHQEHVLLWDETAYGGPAKESDNTFPRDDSPDAGFGKRPEVFKNECVPYLYGKTILADRIYSDFSFFNESNPVKVLTPHKEIKGEADVIRQRKKAARDIFSRAVSKARQPIESFFNWLNEKTEIQRASKVRATKGLLVHTFGKLAIALLTFVDF